MRVVTPAVSVGTAVGDAGARGGTMGASVGEVGAGVRVVRRASGGTRTVGEEGAAVVVGCLAMSTRPGNNRGACTCAKAVSSSMSAIEVGEGCSVGTGISVGDGGCSVVLATWGAGARAAGITSSSNMPSSSLTPASVGTGTSVGEEGPLRISTTSTGILVGIIGTVGSTTRVPIVGNADTRVPVLVG